MNFLLPPFSFSAHETNLSMTTPTPHWDRDIAHTVDLKSTLIQGGASSIAIWRFSFFKLFHVLQGE
jgi:hypothetical protein